MSGELLLGVDIGTSSAKGVLTTTEGKILAQQTLEHDLIVPRPGWAEHDPERTWWGGFVEITRRLLGESEYSGRDVAAVAVSAIGPCVVAVDGRDRATGPGILYGVDTRSTAEIAALERFYGREEIFAIAGSHLSTQSGGPKIMWLKDNAPHVYTSACFFHSAADYIVLRLTGRHVMDAYTASSYAPLFDLAKGTWTDRFATRIVSLERLPEVHWATEVAGEIGSDAAKECGLVAGTPVTVGTVDAVAESVSVGAIKPGDLMCMYGSSIFFILATSTPVPHPAMWGVCHALPGVYGIAAGMSTGGSVTRWFRDELARDLAGGQAFEALAKEASGVAPGSLGLVMLPYFSGERTPINDPQARGVICGLTLAHTRAHLFRAILESVAYGIEHNLAAIQSTGTPISRIVAVGGGAKNELWLQIVSDVSGLPQQVPKQTIGAAYGDAFLAGLAAGLIPSVDTLHDSWVVPGRTIESNVEAGSLYREYVALYHRLYSETSKTQHELAGLSARESARGLSDSDASIERKPLGVHEGGAFNGF